MYEAMFGGFLLGIALVVFILSPSVWLGLTLAFVFAMIVLAIYVALTGGAKPDLGAKDEIEAHERRRARERENERMRT